MDGGLFLDVVVGKSTIVLELLTGKDQTLLIRWDSFSVLDLVLKVADSITGLNVQGDVLTSKGLYEDLHWSGTSLVIRKYFILIIQFLTLLAF